MATINVDVDICIEDYLEEVSSRDLFAELRSRCVDVPPHLEDRLRFGTDEQKLSIIKLVLELKEYATADDILKEMKQLLIFTNQK